MALPAEEDYQALSDQLDLLVRMETREMQVQQEEKD